MRHTSNIFPVSVTGQSPTRQSSTRQSFTRQSSATSFHEDPAAQLANWRDVRMFRTWAAYDFGLDWDAGAENHSWRSVLGIGCATLLSAGFWAVLAVVIAHFWG